MTTALSPAARAAALTLLLAGTGPASAQTPTPDAGIRQPSDLGYPNDGYNLPPLRQQSHTVAVDYEPSIDTGLLFPMEAHTMQERIAARRDSVEERVALAASITPADRPFVWWCNLNSEADALAKTIPGAVNLSGSDDDEMSHDCLLKAR